MKWLQSEGAHTLTQLMSVPLSFWLRRMSPEVTGSLVCCITTQ